MNEPNDPNPIKPRPDLLPEVASRVVSEIHLSYVGVSNFSGWQLMKSLAVAERYGYPRYVAHQVYYSLVGRDYEWELLPLGRDQGVGAVVWSPLGWGRLTGKVRRGQPLPERSRLHATAELGPPVEDEHLFGVVDALDEVAKETGKAVPQIAIAWLLQRPTVSSVIIGARDEEQLRQNLAAVGWTLTPDQMARLDAASARTAPYPRGSPKSCSGAATCTTCSPPRCRHAPCCCSPRWASAPCTSSPTAAPTACSSGSCGS
jgi:aryl-alcohol dehydrogenase-like predicted oxidoreductase